MCRPKEGSTNKVNNIKFRRKKLKETAMLSIFYNNKISNHLVLGEREKLYVHVSLHVKKVVFEIYFGVITKISQNTSLKLPPPPFRKLRTPNRFTPSVNPISFNQDLIKPFLCV